MFKFFHKKSEPVKTVIYIRDQTPINDFDLIKMLMILINCPTKDHNHSLHKEPFLTAYQYDRLCEFNLGKYFQPVLLTSETNNK